LREAHAVTLSANATTQIAAKTFFITLSSLLK
jgi:hypothetical protein